MTDSANPAQRCSRQAAIKYGIRCRGKSSIAHGPFQVPNIKTFSQMSSFLCRGCTRSIKPSRPQAHCRFGNISYQFLLNPEIFSTIGTLRLKYS
ncbi:hypothetical protein [Shinella zoogloeoides]|uniref:Uncharacterized protein n=1 Tax=Shinella zoogloeoides TaxID=352475 RepID=A0A6N8TKT0_SHIZO|nr:hypothetical protein [Shinella zoogloeoides]MXO02876.1 hypothetical protein [Shinella zoogloeoides]UEX84274.1 hypothetical protein K8M09_21475 [Shinella zoogloeoides]